VSLLLLGVYRRLPGLHCMETAQAALAAWALSAQELTALSLACASVRKDTLSRANLRRG
jgi:hypothetical protein